MGTLATIWNTPAHTKNNSTKPDMGSNIAYTTRRGIFHGILISHQLPLPINERSNDVIAEK
jgi:hypothetical protein